MADVEFGKSGTSAPSDASKKRPSLVEFARIANMAKSVDEFATLLVRSRLYKPLEVKSILERWRIVAIEPNSASSFQNWLIAKDYLTDFQSSMLQNGQSDNILLGPYKIIDRIGTGKTASIFKAITPQQQVVAVKVLAPKRARNPEIWARFQREMQLARQLQHPGIVRTYTLGHQNNLHYLVMEYMEGETLEQVLRRRTRLSPHETARIGFLATLALQHVFEKGLVHRDLKPGNIMLCPAPAPQENTLRSMVKIFDIGHARELFDAESKPVRCDLTSDGAILGTPDYMAPEQTRDARRVDIRADLYSLGCILYQCLAGEPPFADQNLVRLILRHANEEPRPLREFRSDVHEHLEGIILTMMEKDAAMRHPTPEKAANDFKNYLATDGRTAQPVRV